jgi:4-hydroxymandelate oxidase
LLQTPGVQHPRAVVVRIFRSFALVHENDHHALISLAEYERAAEAVLDDGALAYVAGGAADGTTMRDNLAAWNRIAIRPRMLIGAGHVDTSIELLGRRRPHPILIAPTAFHALAHPEAEVATARAAAATGTVMCVSTYSNRSLEQIAQNVPELSRWFQLYVLRDRGLTRELVHRAAQHGYEALVVTVDHPVGGVRDRELRWPLEVSADQPGDDDPAVAAVERMTPTMLEIDPDLNWRDIEDIVSDTALPVLVKGILTAQDARLAAEHGAAGVIVSNHGGRQLDTVLATTDALGEVADAVRGRIEILADGGLRRGTDVLKALALGARAVLLGRPIVCGLAVGGAAGVQRVIEILRNEFDNALRLAGAPDAALLDGSYVQRAPWAPPAP